MAAPIALAPLDLTPPVVTVPQRLEDAYVALADAQAKAVGLRDMDTVAVDMLRAEWPVLRVVLADASLPDLVIATRGRRSRTLRPDGTIASNDRSQRYGAVADIGGVSLVLGVCAGLFGGYALASGALVLSKFGWLPKMGLPSFALICGSTMAVAVAVFFAVFLLDEWPDLVRPITITRADVLESLAGYSETLRARTGGGDAAQLVREASANAVDALASEIATATAVRRDTRSARCKMTDSRMPM